MSEKPVNLAEDETSILLVDDNPANLMALREVLGGLKTRLVEARSGIEALRHAIKQDFAAILLDVNMPGMDGFETAELLRQHRRTEHTPILFVTAINTSPQDMTKGYRLGAVDYVSKPLIPEILRTKIQVFVELYEHRKALRKWSESLEEQVKQRTAQLEHSEQRFRQLSEFLPVGILLVDEEGMCHYANPSWSIISGQTWEACRGKGWQATFQAPQLAQLLINARKGVSGEYQLSTPVGGHTWVVLNTAELPGTNDTRQLVYTFVDVSDRRVAEEQRAELEQQLMQSQKLEAVGTLAAGIAHDFNNVLAVIVTAAELAERQLSTREGPTSALESIRDAGTRGANIVRQLMLFSKPQPAGHQLVNSRLLLQESLRLLRSSLPSTIELAIEVPEDCPMILGNASQIQQVIINLGSNAWHSMRERGGRLDFRLSVEAVDGQVASKLSLQPGNYVKLSARDQGHGMDPQILQRVFEPFFTTKPVGEGSGMGLSVVHGIVRGHQGAITVESEPDRGTCFDVYLPTQGRGGFTQIDTVKAEDKITPGNGEHIVIIDDNASLLFLRKSILQSLGYEVSDYTQPEIALRDLVEMNIDCDVVVTDFAMPAMDGLKLAAALHECRPELPILLCTGYEEIVEREKLSACGVQCVLPKPTTLETLSSALFEALTERKARNRKTSGTRQLNSHAS